MKRTTSTRIHAAAALAALAALALVSAAATRGPAAEPQGARATRVLLIYDMEGITGAVRPTDVNFGSATYQATRESLVEDVNAAIRGLKKAGATEIVVIDGHGSGSPDPDYILDRMPAGARHEMRDEPFDPYIELMDQRYDAMVAIAMHSKAGTNGFLAHTYNGHTRWVMGGHDMNESMLVAASAARYGTPVILVTGDDVLAQEVKAFSPLTEYVTVKQAIQVDSAQSRPRADVSAAIEAAAERGLRNVKSIPPWDPKLPAEFDNHYGYVMPEQAAVAINFPGATVVDNKTVRVMARSFIDSYLAFRALAGFTGLASTRVVLDGVRSQAGGPALIRQAQSQLPGRLERTFAATGTTIPRGFGRHGYR
ncbi:MAG: M55 family metallopeptidase [Gemmatimonadetes bacterium]|nr:M55 family metallopeptidase [Gemmatimonadota bacterium]